jgi:hypothetical protein
VPTAASDAVMDDVEREAVAPSSRPNTPAVVALELVGLELGRADQWIRPKECQDD